MPAPDTALDARRTVPRRNLVILGAGLASIAAGYVVLAAGHPSAGAVLLVLGYCVLIPLGIAI